MKNIFFKILFFFTFIVNSQELLLHYSITGSWLPVLDASVIGPVAYTFTPDADQCGEIITHTITTTSLIIPVFNDVPSELCIGSSYVLPTVSDNLITGSWSPELNTSITDVVRYTFTPDLGESGEIITKDITVSSSIIPVFNSIFPVICENAPLILPTISDNLITGSWSSVLDTSILSSQSYIFTPDTGQCGEVISFRITVNPSMNSLFNDLPSELCVGSSYVLPTISNNLVEGNWSPELDTSIIGTKDYIFIPDTGQCGETITHNITINSSIIYPVFNNIPSELCVGSSYVLPTISDNLIEGSWFPEINTSVIGTENYIFTPNSGQCGASIEHTMQLTEFNEITIPVYFTPNNDGMNDYWKIEGLENMQNIDISIFDRYGRLLNNYDPEIGWDGLSNGVQMLSNDYWYLIEGVELSCGKIKKKGHFSLIRN